MPNQELPGEKQIGIMPADSGKVIPVNSEYFAVFKDPEGKLHAVSAVCTHMGCIVDWNKGDKTWECPCHSSRFDNHGKVINGPAIKDLQRKKIPTKKSPGE